MFFQLKFYLDKQLTYITFSNCFTEKTINYQWDDLGL